MKYILNVCLVVSLSLIFFSCEDKSVIKNISEAPTEFTKKVLIEEFTGSWCGYCPSGAETLSNLISNNNKNVIGVAIHSGDQMATTHAEFLENTYVSAGYPSGMIDRVSYDGIVCLNRGYWDWITQGQLVKTAICGLAIKSEVNGENANIEVHTSFDTTLNKDNYKLNVYLIEDNISQDGNGYDQRNYYNEDPQSSFYELGDPIINYKHNHTLRETLSVESLGDAFTKDITPGITHVKEYSINISEYNKNNLSIVSFVVFIGENANDHEVLNVQKTDIDGVQDWD